jgi:RNA polymerase sigma factor (sigma-70 family)
MPSTTSSAPDDPSDDLRLVRGFLAGDPEAVRRLGERLRRIDVFVRRIVGRSGPSAGEDLDDLAQACAAAVIESLKRYEGRGPLDAWIYRVCLYTVWQSRRQRRDVQALDVEPEAPGVDPDVENARDRVRELMKHVGGMEADILRMRFFDELDFATIAARLDRPVATVRSLYYRATKRIRRHGEDENP